MNKHLILIHGRHFKPKKNQLEKLWFEALRYGISEDFNNDVAKKFDDVQKQFVYFGDISNKFLRQIGKDYDLEEDLEDRRISLNKLKSYNRNDFLGNKGKKIYSKLEGKTSLKEAAADLFAGPLDFIGLSERLITAVAPDMREYWNPDSEFGSEIRWRLTKPLKKALKEKSDILLISHSLGTLVAYDTLWKFSRYAEYKSIQNRKVSMLVTMGSPLGNETVKKNLKGAKADGPRKYPANINLWVNIAAEDDYISHDQTVSNDYKKMQKWNLISSISDKRIYNLSLRGGKSNPHHAAGYLIHPSLSKIVADWLE